MIKHVSFDFWDTLYNGNPNFRVKRAEYIQKKYGHIPAVVHAAVEETKRLCDGTSEKTMCCVSELTQAWVLLDNLGCASIEGAVELSHETHRIFLENPPVKIYDPKDLIAIRNSGRTISISCNTGLINGDSIVQMMKETGSYDLFDFTLFSDRITYFKPSPFFMLRILGMSSAASFEEILHVGDNPNTDGYMCQLTGANYLQNKKGTLDFKEIQTYL